jgi:hypothetical protein
MKNKEDPTKDPTKNKNRVKEIVAEFSPWDFDERPIIEVIASLIEFLEIAKKDNFKDAFVVYDPNTREFDSFKVWAWRPETPQETRQRLARIDKKVQPVLPEEAPKGFLHKVGSWLCRISEKKS